MGNASALADLLLLFGAATASPASAQPTTVDGAYAKLTPGNAKIARALHQAQVTPTTTTAGSAASRTLSVDQIAAMRQNGQGWGQVFQTMKSQGLLIDKNLGQVVSRYQQRIGAGAVVPASNRATGPAARVAQSDDAETKGK